MKAKRVSPYEATRTEFSAGTADADAIFALKWDENDRHNLKVWTIKARYGSRAPFEMYVNAETCLIADNEAALLTEGAGADDIW